MNDGKCSSTVNFSNIIVIYSIYIRKNKLTYMKNILSFLFLITTLFSFSQVNYYTFSETTGTYTSITGGTQLVTTTGGVTAYDTDGSYFTLPVGSQFNFNGTTITSVNMTADGALYLNPGTTTTGNGTTGSIASTATATGIICAMNMDLRSTAIASQVYERRWQDVGTDVVFQWQNCARYSTTSPFVQNERFSFQIRITKSTGVVKVVYGNMTTIANSTQYTPMVGLRGSVNTDFKNRRLTGMIPDNTPNWGAPNGTTAGTSNAHTVRFTSAATCYPSSGLTFIWTPPAVPTNDACANATSLDLQCPGSTTGTLGTTIGSITTDGLSNPSCDLTGTIRDVWYSFNTGNNTEINLYATLGTATWIGVEIYTSCGTLATGLNTSCDFNIISPNPTNITGLAMNTTYRLRIFTNVSYDTPGTFTIYLNTVNNTSTLSSAVGTNNQTLCQNSPITNITYNTKGATGATFTGLPTGVSGSWSSNIITISGTPTVSGTFNYTATLTGGCGTVTSNGTITVNPVVSTISTISGNSVIIAGTTEVYSIPSDPNATTYQWDYKESASGSWITNVSNTTSASIDWSLTTTSGAEVLVTVTNGCGSQSKNLTIYVDGVLPIELLSFTGKVIDSRNVLLEWSTASEQSNDYFIIERSTDGYDWTQIKNIDGSGNSNTKINYTTIDNSAPRTIVYYRLSQVDFDGVSETFNPIDVNLKLIDKNCDYVFYDLNGKLIDINTVSSGVYLKSCGGETIKIWKY
jgi:hypothetical protein